MAEKKKEEEEVVKEVETIVLRKRTPKRTEPLNDATDEKEKKDDNDEFKTPEPIEVWSLLRDKVAHILFLNSVVFLLLFFFVPMLPHCPRIVMFLSEFVTVTLVLLVLFGILLINMILIMRSEDGKKEEK